VTLLFNGKLAGRSYAVAAITATAAGLLVGAAGITPASAATAGAPAPSLRVGQVLAQAPRSADGCGPLAQPLTINVQSTAAHPDAYAFATVNSQCQVVVSNVGYGTLGAPSASPSTAAGSTAAATRGGVAADSTCKHETWAQSSIWDGKPGAKGSSIAELIPSWLDYQQACSGGAVNAKSWTFPSKNSHYVVPTTWGTTFQGNPDGFTGNMSLLKLEYPSTTVATGLAEAQIAYWWEAGILGTPAQYSYSIRTYNKTYSNGAITGSCQVYVPNGSKTDSLAGLSIGCNVGRDS
jgi:hypothetical protein